MICILGTLVVCQWILWLCLKETEEKYTALTDAKDKKNLSLTQCLHLLFLTICRMRTCYLVDNGKGMDKQDDCTERKCLTWNYFHLEEFLCS